MLKIYILLKVMIDILKGFFILLLLDKINVNIPYSSWKLFSIKIKNRIPCFHRS